MRLIEDFVSLECLSLETVVSENRVLPEIREYTFDEKNKITVYVPNGCIVAYKSHELWGKMNIRPMSELPKGKIE